MIFALIMVGCLAFGLVVGRWWAVLGAIPLGVVMGAISDPWEVSRFYCGVIWTVAGVVGITPGVGLRKLADVALAGRRDEQAGLS